MKKRTVVILMCMTAGIGALSVCARPSESSLVKQKDADSIKNYEEGTSLEKQTETKENKRKLALNAPEAYKSEVSDETGKLKIITDAVVEIPDADRVSAITVTRHPLNQTLIDRITETFFPTARFYSAESWYALTKDDWLKNLEELKGFAEEGNLDPYHRGTDENGNLIYDIYESIENVQEAYENAPEKRTPVEVKPRFGLETVDNEGNVFTWENDFQGIAVNGDGSQYSYEITSYDSMPMFVRIDKFNKKDEKGNSVWSEYDTLYAASEQAPELKEIKDHIGISLKQAKKDADEKVKKLDIPFMEMTDWEYGILWEDIDIAAPDGGGYTKDRQLAYGYILHYTRNISHIPITYTIDWGGAMEEMDSDMETWGYERLDFYITKDGIHKVEFSNLYDIGEVQTENLTLKAFEEIMEIYEKMMLIKNADIINYESYRTYYIDRITFGYARIYEPASDSKRGLLVPVWNFFGKFEHGNAETNQKGVNASRFQSYLTINGADGSLIDMAYGY